MVATFPQQPSDLALVGYLRSSIRGEVLPWIHGASVYTEHPATLTARYTQTTAANGDQAWYFLCVPKKKEGRTKRFSRLAGNGTWKEDRHKKLFEVVSTDGARQFVGVSENFAFMEKTEGDEKDTRQGWLMLSIKLAGVEEDSQGRCLCKIYPSPRKDKQANTLVPVLPALGHVPLPAAAAATTTPSTEATSAASAASATGSSSAAAAAARASAATASSSATASAPVATAAATAAAASAPATAAAAAPATAAAATATTPTGAATEPTVVPAATAPAVAATPAAATSVVSAAAVTSTESPPKRWVQIQISNSPTKSSKRGSAKRVYQMIVPSDEETQEEVSGCSHKKMKFMECNGWLTLEPMCIENNQVS